MESPLSRKLSNATTFSAKSPYDGVFSGHRHSYAGASTINAQDYREIFGSSPAATSIPVLDLSTLGERREPSEAFSLNFRGSKADYSKIFSGLRDEDVAVSYEELFARDKPRAPSSRTSSSPDSDNLSNQSSDALKQFNMSYNKISQKSKDGLEHVTKLHAIPGFTRFIDEAVPPLMETKKNESSEVHVSVDSSKSSKLYPGESFSEDKFSKKVHPSKISSPSASPTNEIDHKDYPKRSTAINSESCKTDTSESAQGDEELDVNSAASALKKAIEKAQESIRIAKESVGRKKKGLRSFSSKTFKDSLKGEEHTRKDEVRASPQDEGRNRKYGGTSVFPDFINGEKLFGAKKVMDEIHEKISESTKEFSPSVESSTQVTGETECRPLDSAEKDEYATLSSETVDTEKSKTGPSDFLHADQTDNMSDDNESKIKEFEGPQEDEASVQRPEDFLYDKKLEDFEETIEDDMSKESKEDEDEDEVRSSNTHELVDESNNLTTFKEVEDEEKASQEEILEQEHIENAEKAETSEWHERENESKDDNATEIHEEQETSDNSIQESEESALSFDDKLEESEVNLQDDYEMKQEDNDRSERNEETLDNDCDQELEKTSIDQTSSDENEDEHGTEETDLQSESSSSREEELEESNTQSPHKQIPEVEITNKTEKTMEVEEIKTRINEEMERKKDRLAVDRAIREARERARERAERAAVEKATQEIRQRMMADAQQKAAKASAQSKLRAERAAVERATSEARQRALMKAMSQKNETPASNGTSSESALRSKAKLEKHNKIMERAAKALAEKEKRDLLAQKEQAERNRLAENLDADIKRWSNGKEGNLRALLSTLQYILGPQSGWEAVSLTEIVATSAVKKAYRKATLCVHPDKLQQRGASIQHKYICEKVFDLLKAAWNKFNSEER